MEHYRRDDLVFDVRDAGPPDGSVVVLLHGFPQRNDSWNAVIDRLTAEATAAWRPTSGGIHRAPGHPAAATTACRNSSPTSAH
jgi:pimeloyl-ACP methyl ester carboxylesterase